MSRTGWIALIGLWAAMAGCGYWLAVEYQSTAAPVRTPPTIWPTGCDLPRDPRRPTLLVFIHPKCPCTRATLAELNRLLARHPERVSVLAIFLRPDGVSSGWEQTDLWSKASALPGVRLLIDHQGVYRRAFHTSVSGECVLYDTDGRLRFHGGITSGRGHEGENLGEDSLAALLLNQIAPANQTPVFGCALEQPGNNQEALP